MYPSTLLIECLDGNNHNDTIDEEEDDEIEEVEPEAILEMIEQQEQEEDRIENIRSGSIRSGEQQISHYVISLQSLIR